MTDPVQEAINRARAAASTAAAAPSAPSGSTEVAVQQGGAVGMPAPQKLSMETMQAGQMSVDVWLKVKEDGLKIGDMQGLLQEITASILMVENRGFVLKFAIKGGNPAQYAYTFDLATAVGGGTWEEAQRRIRAVAVGEKKVPSPYRAVDLPFTLVGDVKVGDKVVGTDGAVMGYTTSTTNWGNWEAFHREVEKAGLMGKRVLVKLTAQPKKNASNTWGVLKMDLIGEAPEEE